MVALLLDGNHSLEPNLSCVFILLYHKSCAIYGTGMVERAPKQKNQKKGGSLCKRNTDLVEM